MGRGFFDRDEVSVVFSEAYPTSVVEIGTAGNVH